MNEFQLIQKYFHRPNQRNDVLLNIGDDAAMVKVPDASALVITVDTLIEDIHFPKDTPPFDIGYKSLAINLSDLAAMAAEPAWATLALTLPKADDAWLKEFSAGFFQLADQFNLALIGGDTTHGSLSITVQVHGFVPPHQALRRSGAKVGDKIYVSGTLGDAGLALQILKGKYHLPEQEKTWALQRLNQPTPRVVLGIALRNIATSAIDISDGLAADLTHILKSSGVGATLIADQLPLSAVLQNHLSKTDAHQLALTAGDDYELCFTIPPQHELQLLAIAKSLNISCQCIGEIQSGTALQITGFSGDLTQLGYLHF